MTAPFVTNLRRCNDEPIHIGKVDGQVLRLRAQVASMWDAIRIDTAPDATVREVKLAALETLVPDSFPPDQYVVKLRGFEVLDENVTVTDAGALDGSIFLILDRRRRPIR
ncbi:MAG: hypothetical protein H0U64_08490 [Gemmatimonadaceae bacterium]|nr:hypothetical protein [Gemmatimonadaceae bacterium]